MARYSGAVWRPTAKFGYGTTKTHTPKNMCIHDAEGPRTAMHGVLDGPREAAWHFSVFKDGTAEQHIDTLNIPWTNGNFAANNGSITVECEGKAGEALTPAQLSKLTAIMVWVFQTHGFGHPVRKTNLFEHREFVATACPSGRVPWATLIPAIDKVVFPPALTGIGDLTPVQEAALKKQVQAYMADRDKWRARYNTLLAKYETLTIAVKAAASLVV